MKKFVDYPTGLIATYHGEVEDLIKQNVDYKSVDHGIGPYEFWGSQEVHVDMRNELSTDEICIYIDPEEYASQSDYLDEYDDVLPIIPAYFRVIDRDPETDEQIIIDCELIKSERVKTKLPKKLQEKGKPHSIFLYHCIYKLTQES
jgi:hypothetical protein|tara:strand:- start:1215 stop:1652 length:438 start_codon:yes stop_codon:yes gene_type:complete